MLKRTTAFISAIFILFAAQAAAGNFTSADVENFIKVSDEMQGLEGKYPEVEVQIKQDMMGPNGLNNLLDENGNFAVFKRTMARLPAGEARNEVTGIVKGNGFSSLDSFAGKADHIMMAYMALNMDGQDMGAMAQMDDATLAMMPPSVQAQMKAVKKMVTAVQNVPQGDRDTLRPLMAKLDASFQN